MAANEHVPGAVRRKGRPARMGALAAALLVIGIGWVTEGSAQENEPQPSWKSPRAYAFGALGYLDAPGNPGQPLSDTSGPLLVIGIGARPDRNIALDFEVVVITREYDAPPKGAMFLFDVSDRMELASNSALLSARGICPVGPFEPYLGAGIGVNRSVLEIPGAFLGIPGTVEKETDVSLAYKLEAGLDVALSKKVQLSASYRRLMVRAHLGELAGGQVDLGGHVFALGIRYVVSSGAQEEIPSWDARH